MPGGETRRSVRFLLAAAAVLAVVAAGVTVFASRGGDGGPRQVATQPDPPPTAGDDPSAIWNVRWQVERITEDGRNRPVVDAMDGGRLVLDATTEGRVVFNGCNGTGGEAIVDGERLRVDELGPSTLMACEGEGLMEQEEWLGSFLLEDPAIAVDGARMTLSTDTSVLELSAIVAGQGLGP